MHLTFLQPMAPGLKQIMQRFRQVMTIEGNWCDRPDDEIIDDGQPPLLAARDAAALALPDRCRLLERGEGPADQARRHPPA